MTVLFIALLVLLLVALVPFSVRLRYDENGFFAAAKAGPVTFQFFPTKEKSREKKAEKETGKEPPEQAEDQPKGGLWDVVKAALPLVKPTLAGIKKRLTIRSLTLHVTWGAPNPADAATGYGSANALLGMLWAVVDENFKVKHSSLGCSVDFDAPSPTVYANAILSVRLGQIITLGIPLLVRFLRNTARLKRARSAQAVSPKSKVPEKNRKEA